MTEAQAIEAILQHWRTGWEALHPTVPWTTENEVYEAAAAWVRITITSTVSAQATMGPAGARRWDRRGIIAVQVFARPDEGVGTAAGLCDDVRAVLEGVALTTGDGTVHTYAGTTGGESTDGAWLMRMVTTPVWWQQTR